MIWVTRKTANAYMTILKPKPALRSSEQYKSMSNIYSHKPSCPERWYVWRKTWMIMRLTILLIIISTLTISAKSYSQKVTLTLRDVPIEKVFTQIREQTGCSFLWTEETLRGLRPVSVSVHNASLTEAVQTALKGLPLAFNIHGNVVYIEREAIPPLYINPNTEPLVIPQHEITGIVIDSATGNPLTGVTIQVEGTANGTTTNLNGKFSLTVNNNVLLRISFLGYTPKEIRVHGSNNLRVLLSLATTGLSQLVVIGYGTEEKKNITGNISVIKSSDITKVNTTSFTNAIEGQVPGVFVSQTSGAPGATASVRIQGVGTTGSNQPLYIVDGVPINSSPMGISGSSNSVDPLSIINPNDIESIEILKDASASAIYGARAANGVILITTKTGQEGNINVNFQASTGFSQVWRKPAFLNAEEFATVANELYKNSGLTPNPQWTDPASLGKGTDMVGLIFRNAPQHNYNLSISGGSKKITARASLGYTDEEGTMIETSYKRYTGRVSVNAHPINMFHFGGSFGLATTQSNGQNTDAMQGGILNLAEQFIPTLSADSPFFGSALYYTKDGDNPILRAETINNNLSDTRLLGTTFGEVEIIPNLKFRTTIGIDADFNRTSSWQGKIERGFYIHPLASLSEEFNNSFTWDIINTLSYSKQFGNNLISAVLGQEGWKAQNNWLSSRGNDYLNESLRVINASNVNERSTNGTGSVATLASYFGRINYSFKDKYLLSVSLRKDGSSNFGPNNKWGYFPAISGGWRISDEPFMKSSQKIISNLKIRASWGQVGNDAIPPFGYLSTINYGAYYVLGPEQSILTGTTLSKPANPNLKWETDEETDLGIDATFLENKISFTADYYIKNTIGMLVNLPVSMESGFSSSPSINGGSVRNSGLELSLGYRDHFGKLNFNINGNMATLKNKVMSLGVGQPIVGGSNIANLDAITYTTVGMPIGYFRGYIVTGVYQTIGQVNKSTQPSAVAGDLIYKDVNGDGQLTDVDKVYIGKPWPSFTYGLSLNGSYSGLDLSIFFQGVGNVQIFDANIASNYQIKYFNGNGVVNGLKAVLHAWTPGSGIQSQPGLKFTDANGNYTNPSSFFVKNGAFMRVRNIVIGYTLPTSVLRWSSSVLSKVRLYLSSQNILTFTHYPGFDPEIGSLDPLSSGIDTGVYPQPRTFIAGIDVNF